ncbi:hypothetical protein C0Q70_09366 [Pomacea canaliculata]|uniref:Uncharacterized protein n=1 Tax=Pomacea canaliculata TaxID=400727 RepID=A0A2T7P9L0_POMCA|nr:hypothetical protein C0Q70_09366 [Pomacea canaliculata]
MCVLCSWKESRKRMELHTLRGKDFTQLGANFIKEAQVLIQDFKSRLYATHGKELWHELTGAACQVNGNHLLLCQDLRE